MDIFRFEDTHFLAFLILIPLMLVYGWRNPGSRRIRFSSLAVLKQVKRPPYSFLQKWLILFRCLAVCLFILAFARPQYGTRLSETITEGIDIMLCLDTSGSMKDRDFPSNGKKGTRLQAVKNVVGEFIDGRRHDRIGMVVFGEEAYTQCPLTHDYAVLLDLLDNVEIGMAGDSTAIGSALGVCIKRLKDRQSKSRVIILLTDGMNNTGSMSPVTAADGARAFNIKTYTIGVGTEGEPPYFSGSFLGKQYVYQKEDLDEETLKIIAKKTGGQYFRATNAEALQNIYRQIDGMEKTKVEVKEYMKYRELFMYFLFPGLFFLLLEVFLTNTRLLKIP